MKITVLGAGNGGCFTALNYGWSSRNIDDVEIELIHNPDIPAEKVGQGTQVNVTLLLELALGFNWYNNNFYATPKTGILYEGWGKANKEFFHPFPPNYLAVHYCPTTLQNTILKSGHFKVIEKDVSDPKEIDADYVFDCRGTPKDFTDYNTLINPVNSAILAKPNWRTSEVLWTRAVATPDGWCFIIPSSEESPSFEGGVGYLYNRDITNLKNAEQNLLNMFDVDITNHLTFKNYVAKNPVIDDRIFLNGNRLCFLEPLEATAIETYLKVSWIVMDQIIHKKTNSEQTRNSILKLVDQIQTFILWHYYFGSKYDTLFWKEASKLSFQDPTFYSLIDKVKREIKKEERWADDDTYSLHNLYGVWLPFSVDNWYRGMMYK